MKTCSKCKNEKPLSAFGKLSKAPDGLQYYCKLCKAIVHQDKKDIRIPQILAAKKERIKEHRRRIYAYFLQNPCECGESDPVVLEFDHNDGTNKSGNISKMVIDGVGWERISAEIDKCTVRCANCHARRTAKQFGWWKHPKEEITWTF